MMLTNLWKNKPMNIALYAHIYLLINMVTLVTLVTSATKALVTSKEIRKRIQELSTFCV